MNHSVPNTVANISSGIASIAPASLVWLAWQASAWRLSLDEVGHVDGVVDLDLRGAERVAVVGRAVGIPLLTAVGERRTRACCRG